MQIKCVAIDDEPLALRQINSYIQRVEFLELADSWSDSRRALESLRSSEKMLVFIDIDMPDINGIELVNELNGRHFVIFTTAYSEYAIDGFRLNAIDYLLKPFSFSEFERAVNKARMFFQADSSNHMSSADTSDVGGYISVKADYKVTPVKINDIIFIESVGEYVRLNLRNGSSITTLYRLKNMESELPQTQFTRIHRSYIVNMAEVQGYSRVKITISNQTELPIGDSYRESLIAKLDEFHSMRS